jgi:surface polysaccharide O-acyltransferase-like enzyme
LIAAKSHIEWIDGAKGVAIISVILLHSLPCLYEIGSIFHIGQAVPVFLFITAYLTSTRFDGINKYFTRERIWKLIKNVLIPFLVVLFIQLVCLAIDNRLPSFKSILKSGGVGPGSYYVWLYMLTWVIVPFIALMVRRVPIWVSMFIMLLIAIGAEYIFVFLQKIEHIDALYRLLPIRYLIVIYLGCIWPLVDTRQKYILYALACVSGLLIYVDLYVVNNVLSANYLWGGG